MRPCSQQKGSASGSDRPRSRKTHDPTLILTLQPDSRILSTMNSLLHAASTGACPYRPKSDFLSVSKVCVRVADSDKDHSRWENTERNASGSVF